MNSRGGDQRKMKNNCSPAEYRSSNPYSILTSRSTSTKAEHKLTEVELSAKRDKWLNPKRAKWLSRLRHHIEDGTELGQRLLRIAKRLREKQSKISVKNQDLGTRKCCNFKRRKSVSSLEMSMKALSLVPKSSTTKSNSGPVINLRSLPTKEVEGESTLEPDLECLFRLADHYFWLKRFGSSPADGDRKKFEEGVSVAIRGEAKEENLMKMVSNMSLSKL